jgi:hypothetical protein
MWLAHEKTSLDPSLQKPGRRTTCNVVYNSERPSGRESKGMQHRKVKLIVAVVRNFDPNRPDLQEFLSKLAGDALAENLRPRKRRRPATAPKKLGSLAPSRRRLR